MNDLYLKLANSQYTQPLFKALNLPKPLNLKRDLASNIQAPKSGNYLLSSTKGNAAFGSTLKTLASGDASLFVARSTTPNFNLAAIPSAHQASVKEAQIENLGSRNFNGLVFDASGIKNAEELKQLYFFFKQSLRNLRKNGRIIVLAKSASNTVDSSEAAIQGGLEGFIKSLAKEYGKKAITCNLLKLDRGAQKHISSSLYFFLSHKSSYISGQVIEITAGSSKSSSFKIDHPLKGKLALVTGAAQGIGKSTAQLLARDGATVICLDIPANEKATKALANELNGHALSIDLSESEASDKILDVISSQLGGIDIVVHNAGITRDKTLANMPQHFWEQVITINLERVIEINRKLLDNNCISSKGRIICISSISGIAGNFGQSNYALSKSGIAHYTSAMSQELIMREKSEITINAIAPGFIETKMTNQIPVVTREFGRRLNSLSQGGLPEDIAEGVAYFCHPNSAALNGNLLRICGQSLLGK